MLLCQNFEIIASVLIYLLTKFFCEFIKKQHISMYNKQEVLTSIPEKDETDDEIVKWVPKKKHEVLKAKYKCLKKLFQIYDASVIGILPQAEEPPLEEVQESCHRRRRSRRTKTDACAGTTEESSGDMTVEKETVAETVIKDLKLVKQKESVKDESTQDSKEDLTSISESSDYQKSRVAIHHYKQRRRPTRFQMFLQRILGIKQDRYGYTLSNDRIYPSSDNNISNRYEKRRRRGLRFRRIRRPKKIYSDLNLGGVKSPVILSYVQSAQKSCLMDTTPRHCPIVGCRLISYGIINYNDHLNLCHFPDRKYICHYCHEGFSKEYDKTVHENEHLGITKLNTNVISSPSTLRFSTKTEINTQTEPELPKTRVPEEKLKKIVSFFDKITDGDRVVTQMKKYRCSESNIHTLHRNRGVDIDSQISSRMEANESSDSDNKTLSKEIMYKKSGTMSSESKDSRKYPPVRCQLCGEAFDFRRQLSLHLDLEHKCHKKFSKFHSCAGILNRSNDDSTVKSDIEPTTTSNETLTYDPSTNIIYYTSTESLEKCIRSENPNENFLYKWKPETKIIRV